MFKTDRPFGFISKDILWVYQNIPTDNVVLITSPNDYKKTQHKKKHIFIVQGVENYFYLYSYSTDNKILKGRFIILDTEQHLVRAKAIILDREGMNLDLGAFIKSSLPYISHSNKFHKTPYEKEAKKFIDTIKTRVLNQNKVFKKTYQSIHSELQELAKKKLSPIKYGRYKKYISELLVKVVTNNLPYSTLMELHLGNTTIKNKDGYNDVVKYCSTPSTIRTIQTFHDVIINGTEINKALYENYGDAFTLSMLLNGWHPSKDTKFTANYNKKLYKNLNLISKDSLLSKDLLKARNKTDVVRSNGRFSFKIRKGMMIVDNLVKKLNLPEDDYRIVGSPVINNKVSIEKKPFALHGIHSNQVFSVEGI